MRNPHLTPDFECALPPGAARLGAGAIDVISCIRRVNWRISLRSQDI